MLSSTAACGAKRSVSSSWKDEASQATVASGGSSPTSEASGVPTFPATTTGRPASRWMWPISSVVVVFPLVPVTAMKSLGISRQASSSSPITASPRSRAAATTGASRGTPGLLTSVRARDTSSPPGVPTCTSTPASRSLPVSGVPLSQPITSPPRARRASAAAEPDRASPATRYGPGGSSGRGVTPKASRPARRHRPPPRLGAAS
jgi:hypothetical protein